MKALSFFLLPSLFLLTVTAVNAQCTISSTNGYVVHVTIQPKTVAVSTTNCPWGYNYNLGYDYNVTFTGSNIPSALYTLQTIIYCGGQANGGYTMPLTGGQGSSTTTTNPYIGNTGAAYNYVGRPSCQSATVQTLTCNAISVMIEGPGIPYQVVSCNYNGSVLPVELVEYKGAATDNGVELTWSTASEMRNDHFTLYKSADGQNWTQAAKIAGAGTTTAYNAYAWTDEAPVSGVNYYKLTQTDEDGTTHDNGIAAVEYLAEDESAVTVYPNPSTTGAFNVRVISKTKTPVQVVLRDQLGRIAGTTTLTETDSFGNSFLLQDAVATEAGSGFYIVEVIQDGALIGRRTVEVMKGK